MKLLIPAMALVLATPVFAAEITASAPAPEKKNIELSREQLIDLAEKEAAKAYAGGRSNGFFKPRKPDGVVRKISVEQVDGNWNVSVHATLAVNGRVQDIGSVLVVLTPEGKRVGEVVFTGSYAPTTQPG